MPVFWPLITVVAFWGFIIWAVVTTIRVLRGIQEELRAIKERLTPGREPD